MDAVRGDRDDRAAALADEEGQYCPDRSGRAHENVVERGGPLVVRGVERFVPLRAREHGESGNIIEQAIRLVHHGFRLTRPAHVCGQPVSVDTVVLGNPGGGSLRPFDVPADEHKLRALAGQHVRRRQPHPGGAANEHVAMTSHAQIHDLVLLLLPQYPTATACTARAATTSV